MYHTVNIYRELQGFTEHFLDLQRITGIPMAFSAIFMSKSCKNPLNDRSIKAKHLAALIVVKKFLVYHTATIYRELQGFKGIYLHLQRITGIHMAFFAIFVGKSCKNPLNDWSILKQSILQLSSLSRSFRCTSLKYLQVNKGINMKLQGFTGN